MTMKNLLEQAGYVLNPQSGIWASPDFTGIAYSDGDDVEQRLARLIAATEDRSVLSDELKQHITDWPSLYHLSSSRANILRPFEQRLSGAQVLEIGAGCGAITRYLGECGACVLALEGSPRRAGIARMRTRDLSGVEVLSESFDQFRCSAQFDVITLIGVLEYANQFVPGANPTLVMLERARALLKPGGLLLIAIENQLGLKYWAGAPEDHLGIPMYGIEGRYRADQPQTHGRKVLADLLATAGFRHTDFLSALPDYKLPVSIVTSSGLSSPDFDAAALASQSVHRDPQLPKQLAFSLELAWPAVMDNGLGADLANSFLIAASMSGAAALDPAVLAYHYSTERMRDFCKQTVFRRAAGGVIGVHCALLAQSDSAVHGSLLALHIPAHTPYFRGHTLASEFIQLVSRDGWSMDSVGGFLQRYLQIAGSLAFDGQPLPALASAQSFLPGAYFDLVPQNIIRDAQGVHHPIDLEWKLVSDMPVGWLLFRTLLLLVQGVTRFGRPTSSFDMTRRGFFLEAFRSAGYAIDNATLESFAAMEAAVQAEALRRPVDQLSNWWADAMLPVDTADTADTADTSLIATIMQIGRLQQERKELNQQLASRDQYIASLQGALHDMRSSNSWKFTAPLRTAVDMAAGLPSKVKLVSTAIEIGGGFLPTLRTTLQVLRAEGLDGIRWRLSRAPALRRDVSQKELAVRTLGQVNQRVRYYPNPLWDREPPVIASGERRFAVHCHLVVQADAIECLHWLSAIVIPFDLYISVAGDQGELWATWEKALPRVGHMQIQVMPQHIQPLTALMKCFGEVLVDYPAFVHISTGVADTAQAVQSLVGPQGSSGGRLPQLLALMDESVALVLGADSNEPSVRDVSTADASWVERIGAACGLPLDKSCTQWPVHGTTAFLARGAILRHALPVLSLLSEDGYGAARERLLSDALAALLPTFASSEKAKTLQIQQGDSTDDFRHYETQRDYSASIVHRDVKVLSYYLPQFHPTPENDEWHGKGFTEWTKVSAANPLFEGHYQQHIPHPDIGYYLLDSPDILRLQAEQMRQGGVHGQVFYHYWFSGRMILEKPAQMLLAHADIAMPFCFCWANENWTRRWDGNEREILLGQTYSADDARAFIRYLIPFFRDPRYIRVGTRPVLMVYRPSSMPDPAEYLHIWIEECAQAGIDAPYVAAVLTRGAASPADFQMDAGVERPLHDWTDGAVPDLCSSLQTYWPMSGSALSYDQVRDFYMAQNDRKPFDYFRSNVPIWDNTARYGQGALLLHGSTPQSFQQWMEHSIADAQANLPPDRRFVVVNAWNEWAEGAHLEPDTRYGYSYLNSVGRALSGLQYAHGFNAGSELPDGLQLAVHFSPDLVEQLAADDGVRDRFFRCLAQSRVLKERAVCVDYFDHSEALPLARADAASARGDLHIEFRRAVHFAPDVIEHMVKTALTTHAAVICNDYGRRLGAQSLQANGAVHAGEDEHASLLVQPATIHDPLKRECRMRSDAWCFELCPHTAQRHELPQVTTIVRFHKRGRLDDLMRAISCLYVMQDCIVIPLIAAQDLDAAQTAELTRMLQTFDWLPGCEPIVDHYTSPAGQGDLRSTMLNESLRKVATKYAAFLDYDDLLFPDAYAWLIQRLHSTGKAVAFGRVYWTDYRSQWHALLQRHKVFESGGGYFDFIQNNHAPLHSILLDVEQIDRSALIYYPDQRFMEDYLLTLQILKEDNSDWDGLSENYYIGDYIHSTDRVHTLALIGDQVRRDLLNDPEYLLCQKRIDEVRKPLLNR
ncbi:glycoside hydrolase family 99-like domain-containing protein [Acidovorax sp. MR-S7]|uniref:glycoside hydrolase family 99-like domain-containing protein n=1 Tax=Acidovorax sp. MR-S7 TaxID=1268622 RepID=UPI000363E104|nr:glycoside hydrolase family 99-like domain-containing protein [Acidovorax sp. MR-S7]GAD20702.1 hypothetical protein AVS7_00463 [Acidovorax sp. MR-S7]